MRKRLRKAKASLHDEVCASKAATSTCSSLPDSVLLIPSDPRRFAPRTFHALPQALAETNFLDRLIPDLAHSFCEHIEHEHQQKPSCTHLLFSCGAAIPSLSDPHSMMMHGTRDTTPIPSISEDIDSPAERWRLSKSTMCGSRREACSIKSTVAGLATRLHRTCEHARWKGCERQRRFFMKRYRQN